MAEQYPALDEKITNFIKAQHIFFVATAAETGKVNLSPKGRDALRVLNKHQVAWLNLTGSGNETAAHLKQVNRMTIMFCSYEREPLILRLYGKATTVHPRDDQWSELFDLFDEKAGARQIFVMDIDMVQTSCGFAVPYYEYKGDRDTLANWAEKRGPDGIETYWGEKNQTSLDGFDTGIS